MRFVVAFQVAVLALNAAPAHPAIVFAAAYLIVYPLYRRHYTCR